MKTISKQFSNFYSILKLLKKEARLIGVYQNLLKQGMKIRTGKVAYVELHKEICLLWKDFEDCNLTATNLLEEVSSLYAKKFV